MGQNQSAPYPEHAKLVAIRDRSLEIGEFIEWAQERGWWRCPHTIQDVLARFYSIDQNRLEQEKRQMLAIIRGESPP